MIAHKRVCNKKKVCEPEVEKEYVENDDVEGAEEEDMILPSNGRNIFEIINDTYNYYNI